MADNEVLVKDDGQQQDDSGSGVADSLTDSLQDDLQSASDSSPAPSAPNAGVDLNDDVPDNPNASGPQAQGGSGFVQQAPDPQVSRSMRAGMDPASGGLERSLYSGVVTPEDVYKRRMLKKNKTFGNAKGELDGLNLGEGELRHNLMKQRKMAARTSQVIDKHTGKLRTYAAYVRGGAVATPKKVQEEQEAAASGRTQLAEMSGSGADAKKVAALQAETDKHDHEAARLKGLAAEAQTRAAHLDTWLAEGTAAGDKAADLNSVILNREEEYNRIMGAKVVTASVVAPYVNSTRDWTAKWKGDLDAGFDARAVTAKQAAQGKASYEWTTDEIGWEGWNAKILKNIGGALASAVVKTLTFGAADISAETVEGGRDTKVGKKFATWVSDFKRAKATCAEISATGMAGGAKATKVYNFLRMLASWFLPLVRQVSISLSVWGILLAGPTAGVSLSVAAGAVGVAFVTTGLKALIELALVVWSLVRNVQTHDKNARANSSAKSETVEQAVNLAADSATFAAGGLLGSAGGDLVSPGNVLESRMTEFGSTNPSVQYGSMGYGDGGGILAEGLDDGGLMAKTGAKLVSTGAVAAAATLGDDASESLYARDERLKDGQGWQDPDTRKKAASQAKKVKGKGQRLASKFQAIGAHVGSASSAAAGNVDPGQAADNGAVVAGMNQMSGMIGGAFDIEDLDI